MARFTAECSSCETTPESMTAIGMTDCVEFNVQGDGEDVCISLSIKDAYELVDYIQEKFDRPPQFQRGDVVSLVGEWEDPAEYGIVVNPDVGGSVAVRTKNSFGVNVSEDRLQLVLRPE